jgi:hypothetical protein
MTLDYFVSGYILVLVLLAAVGLLTRGILMIFKPLR